MQRQATSAPAEQELTEAVRRVVSRYGSDLSAYFRHVEEVAKKNAKESGATPELARGTDDADSAA